MSSLDGFGIVTLASLFPVALVLTLALFVNATLTADDIRQMQMDAGIFPSCASLNDTVAVATGGGGGGSTPFFTSSTTVTSTALPPTDWVPSQSTTTSPVACIEVGGVFFATVSSFCPQKGV
jgi:hypothetical protein